MRRQKINEVWLYGTAISGISAYSKAIKNTYFVYILVMKLLIVYTLVIQRLRLASWVVIVRDKSRNVGNMPSHPVLLIVTNN